MVKYRKLRRRIAKGYLLGHTIARNGAKVGVLAGKLSGNSKLERRARLVKTYTKNDPLYKVAKKQVKITRSNGEKRRSRNKKQAAVVAIS